MSDQESNKPDNQFQATQPEGDSTALLGEIAGLKEKLIAAEAKSEDHWNQLLRARAEFENFRKRMQRELEGAHKYALERLASELLPVRDSMELGFEAASSAEANVQNLREGADLTLKMLVQVMEKFAIRQLHPLQEKFNPELHQAISSQLAAEVEPNTVISVMQKGYLLHDRLIRPALVVVSRAVSPAAQTPSTEKTAE